MKYNLKVGNTTLKTLWSMLLVLIMTSGFIEPQKTLPAGNVPDNLKASLVDYSQYLNSGKTLHQSFYSDSMKTLVKDRRDYYNEFYSIGLYKPDIHNIRISSGRCQGHQDRKCQVPILYTKDK